MLVNRNILKKDRIEIIHVLVIVFTFASMNFLLSNTDYSVH